MSRMVRAQDIVGRRIVALNSHSFRARSYDRSVAHDPTIVLNDGSALYFVVEETETGEYGVCIGRSLGRTKAPRTRELTVAELDALLVSAGEMQESDFLDGYGRAALRRACAKLRALRVEQKGG